MYLGASVPSLVMSHQALTDTRSLEGALERVGAARHHRYGNVIISYQTRPSHGGGAMPQGARLASSATHSFFLPFPTFPSPRSLPRSIEVTRPISRPPFIT